MPFRPKALDEKRIAILPQTRVTPEERQSAEWLARVLTKKDGVPHSVSDVLRVAVGLLYQREFEAASPEERVDAPVRLDEEPERLGQVRARRARPPAP